jgi:hypothetical protein
LGAPHAYVGGHREALSGPGGAVFGAVVVVHGVRSGVRHAGDPSAFVASPEEIAFAKLRGCLIPVGDFFLLTKGSVFRV